MSSYLTGLVMKPVVDTMVQTGPLAVQVNLKSPWVPFPFYLAGGIGGQIAYMCAPAMLKSANGGTTKPIGTGPFVFSNWIPNDHFTATANPHYWRPGYPYLSSITFKPIADANARAQALQTGAIDIMITDTPQEIVLFRGNRQWSYVDDSGPVIGQPDMNCVQLNLSKPPFDNPNVRLAAAKALSSRAYSKIIDIGVNAPSNGLFTPGSPYYSNPNYPAQDVAGAKSLVKKVQHQTGQPVSFQLVSTNSPEALRARDYMQQQFQNVGFQVSVGAVQQNELINQALAGSFEALEWRQFAAVNPDLNYIFWSSTTVSDSSISINMARNNDPKVEAALQVGRTSLNPTTRVAAYRTVNSLFAKDLPYLWNDRAVWAVVAKPNVQNFNNPTTPTGAKARGLIAGSIWPTQIWRS
jgi:ABC-type transport system substrate-binding protein